MNKLLQSLLLFVMAVAGVFLPVQEAKATHYVGSDITFAYTGTPGWYLLRVTFYRDCGPATAGLPTNISTSGGLTITSIGCNYTVPGPVILNLNNTFDVSEVCPGQLNDCTTPVDNSVPGIQMGEYSGFVNLSNAPTTCEGWYISYDGNARNGGIINLNNGNTGTLNWFTDAFLSTSGGINNNSPIFSSSPAPYVCLNDTVQYNPQVTDPDGDSLVYSLVPARTSPTSTINYTTTGGYSAVQPFGTNSGFPTTLNAQTGQLVFKPVLTGAYVLVLKVEEYRKINGVYVLVGYTHRDVQVQVIACNTIPPVLLPLTIQQGTQPPVTFLPSEIQEVDACASYCITIPATTLQPGATLLMSSNAANEVPNSTFTVTGEGTSSVTGHLCFQPNPALAGMTFSFTVAVGDNACPIPNDFVRAISIKVRKTTGFDVEADQDSICANTPVQLNAQPRPNTVAMTSPEYTSVNWKAFNMQGQQVNGYISNPAIVNPIVTPKRTTRYLLTRNTSFGCVDTSSVIVHVKGLQPIIQSIDVPNTTLCTGTTTQLTANVNASAGILQQDTISWSYDWTTTSLGISDTTVYNPFVQSNISDTVTYYLTVTNGGCTAEDSITLNFVPGATPVISTVGQIPTPFCIGSPISLSASAFGPGAVGSTMSWIAGDSISNVNDTTITAYPLTYPASTYTLLVVTDLGCRDSVDYVLQTDGVQPLLPASPVNRTLCSSNSTDVPINVPVTFMPNVVGAPAVTYQWTPATGLSDPTIPNPLLNYTGIDNLSYQLTVTSGQCSDTYTLNINYIPTVVPFIDPLNDPFCLGDTVDLKGFTDPANIAGADYSWIGDGVNNINNDTTWAKPTTVGLHTYVMTVTVPGCPPQDGPVTINVHGERPIVTSVAGTSPICFGTTTQLEASIENPRSSFVYSWTPSHTDGTIEDAASLSTSAAPVSTIRYFFNASDNGVCPALQDTVDVIVGADVNPSYAVTYSPDSLAPVPLSVTFTDQTITSGPIDSVVWVLSNVNDPSAANLILRGQGSPASVTHEFTENSQWNVTMYVYTPGPDNCVKELQKPLWIGAFIVPNVITPNGDGVNDIFQITNLKPNTQVYVFNRWGKKVADFGQGGSWAPKSDVPAGVYFYSVDEKNTGRSFKGWVEILR